MELGFIIYDNDSATNNQRKNIFPKRVNNHENKPEINKTKPSRYRLDAIRSADIEKIEFIIMQKKALLKNSKDVHESIGCLRSLTPQYHCLTEIGLSNPLASESKNPYLCSEYISTAAKCLF